MKLIAENLVNENGYRVTNLTVNAIYEVVAMLINLNDVKITYHIINDDKQLALYNSHHFEIHDSSIDKDWVIKNGNGAVIMLLPFCISHDTFFDDFHNDVGESISLFEKRFPTYSGL